MARWFGESWGASACEPDRHSPTPVGERCLECSVAIVDGDQGMLLPFVGCPSTVTIYPTVATYHLRCFLRLIGVPED